MHDKVILITGAAKRVGAAISRELHAHGANLMLHYHTSVAQARALQAELNAVRPDSVALLQANLLNIATLFNTVTETVARFGKLDALINNASSFFATPIGEITQEAWSDLIGTNLQVPLFLSQAAAPHLKKSQGCIINITDIHAHLPLKHYVIYSVAKGGLTALTKSLARELGPNVRVNAIAPGPIMWPENDDGFDEVTKKRIINQTILKRSGDAQDIAKAARFLIFEAPYITGQILAVDGGRSINL